MTTKGFTFVALCITIAFLFHSSHGLISYFDFKIQYAVVTRLCHTKSVISVNGEFPGPNSYVREGDVVLVNVTNLVNSNITLHWHGVRQLLSAWADGPAYITQCPIQPFQSYVYRFRIVQQRGTLFWHAHSSWLRATVYGAFIILPCLDVSPPMPDPQRLLDKELPPVLLGEWWNEDVERVAARALATGGGYDVADALTINGEPGDLYEGSKKETVIYEVECGCTYRLRVINAAVNSHMYFAIARHSLTVVEADADWTNPLTRDVILLAPGQTMTVLLSTNMDPCDYYIMASVYSPADPSQVPYPTTPASAILRYMARGPADIFRWMACPRISLPTFPDVDDTAFELEFIQSLRGRPFSGGYNYYDVPQILDMSDLHTIGYILQPCPPGHIPCQGPNGTILSANFNRVTFVTPQVSLLEAYYKHVNGVFTTDFPDSEDDYADLQDPDRRLNFLGTRVKVIPYNASVQIVYQNTRTLLVQSHPIHLHGQSAYVVGAGSGSFDPINDTLSFNLDDPPLRNTISVPAGGWTAIRFRALNPGVWFVHCQLDIHQSLGMDMAFITLDGDGPFESLPPPPPDFPCC